MPTMVGHNEGGVCFRSVYLGIAHIVSLSLSLRHSLSLPSRLSLSTYLPISSSLSVCLCLCASPSVSLSLCLRVGGVPGQAQGISWTTELNKCLQLNKC